MSLLIRYRYRPMVDGAELDRRCLSRYSVQAPVVFTWSDGDQEKSADGWTRDVNGKGAYIYSSSLPLVGTLARVQVILPPLGESGRILSICMDASVVRVELQAENPRRSGFAVQGRQLTVRAATRDNIEDDIDAWGPGL